jgi:hypothetical protein
LGTVDEVGEVEVCNVVAYEDVGVDFEEEGFPGEEEGFLGGVFEDLGAYDLGAGVDCEDVSDEGFAGTCPHKVSICKHNITTI